MTWKELKKTIIAEYDSRNLKSRVRYNAIERIEIFIEQHHAQAIKEVKKIDGCRQTMPEKTICRTKREKYQWSRK
ncbi:hypothetical protein [Bacteroides faecis]|uniref:hypothetical protein n=1 Tax=Bacteroides faecis TaxID=674529 RepID=UPI0039C0B473